MAPSQYDLGKTQTVRDEYRDKGSYAAEKQGQIRESAMAMADMGRDPFDDLFKYHAPNAEDVARYAAINQAAKNFAEVVRANCPFSADYKDAIRKIREARMTANAAIALKGRGI